jgi:hypothetical protein
MTQPKYKPGDYAMLPVRINSIENCAGYFYAVETENFCGRMEGFGVDESHLRPVDPPGHGRHIDADKFIEYLDGQLGSFSGLMGAEWTRGARDALKTTQKIIRAALDAQDKEPSHDRPRRTTSAPPNGMRDMPLGEQVQRQEPAREVPAYAAQGGWQEDGSGHK